MSSSLLHPHLSGPSAWRPWKGCSPLKNPLFPLTVPKTPSPGWARIQRVGSTEPRFRHWNQRAWAPPSTNLNNPVTLARLVLLSGPQSPHL